MLHLLYDVNKVIFIGVKYSYQKRMEGVWQSHYEEKGGISWDQREVASSLVVAMWLMNINGKMKRRIGFGIIIAKTRVNLWAESKMGLKQKIEEGL